MIKSYKLRRHIANAFVYLFLIVMGFVWISPFIYLLMHSFRGGAEIYGSTIIPQDGHYRTTLICSQAQAVLQALTSRDGSLTHS